MTNQNSIKELQIDLARKSKWNIGFYWAGFFYWIFVLIAGNTLPLDSARFVWLIVGLFYANSD